MFTRVLITRVCLVVLLCCASLKGQEIQPEQKAQVDAAVPRKAPATPRQPRRILVTNLSMRDGKPVRGSSAAAIPVGNYAIQQMGKVTGAYEAVFSDDSEMFRPPNIKQFDAVCFNNTLGVLFDDPELREFCSALWKAAGDSSAFTMPLRPSCSIRHTISGPSSAG